MPNIREGKGNVRSHSIAVARLQGTHPQVAGEPQDDNSRLAFLRGRIAELEQENGELKEALETERQSIKRVRTRLVAARRNTQDTALKEILIDLVDVLDDDPVEVPPPTPAPRRPVIRPRR